MTAKKKTKKKSKKLPLIAPLGFSPAQKTASGAGPHGGSKKSKARKERKEQKRRLRRGDWE